MTSHEEILTEEFEVLESIFPEELEKLSDDSVRIRIEPDDPSPSRPLILHLVVVYPPTYPDIIPDLSIEPIDEDSGELDEEETESVLAGLRVVAEETLGMAMTFSIASAARESLTHVLQERERKEKDEDDRKTREYEEEEARKKRGTPLTHTKFAEWKNTYMKELAKKHDREEVERVKAMLPKEREEWKKKKDRLSGKQLFEQSANLATSDEGLYDEDAAEVDMSQYTREAREAERRKEEEEEERRRKGLVADDSDQE